MTFRWTPEVVDTMRRLLAEGLSSSQIAAQIGTTRNAVIGKVHRIEAATSMSLMRKRPRLGVLLLCSLPQQRDPKPKVVKPKPKSIGPSMPGDAGGYRMPKVRLKYKPRKATTLKPGVECGILDVTGCKWPVRDEPKLAGGHAFCNGELHDHRYCQFHAEMSAASYSDELIRRATKAAIAAYIKRAA